MKYDFPFPEINLPETAIDENFRDNLRENGVVLINTQGKLDTNASYISFMSQFGEAMAERDGNISEFIEDGVILNIRTKLKECLESSHQPFATNGLTMHMERAYAPIECQPNYLSLLCMQPPDDSAGGQTIVRSMDSLRRSFSDEEIGIMRSLYPKSTDGTIRSPNPIVAYDRKRDMEYFSFRDIGKFPADWNCDPVRSENVEKLIGKMMHAMYDYSQIFSLGWKPGYLYVIDNKKMFHARTEQSRITPRHLKRIRII